MIVADTNVWARSFLHDDAAQARKARKALAEARAAGGVFVPLIVMAELAWVLRGSKEWTRDRVLSTLESLLQTRGVVVESPALVRDAIEAARKNGKGGFADHLIAQVGFSNGCREVITFENKFGKAAGVRRLA